MAFPARWKTSPDFVLASTKKGSQEARHDPKAQRERMNMFKRQLAANRTKGPEEAMRRVKANIAQRSAPEQPTANSFVTRSMVEALRDERLAEEDSDAVHVSAEDWPFVYFVVALDQMPAASDDMAEYKASKSHTAKERQRFLADRKRRIQQSREQIEKARESAIDMGLRLEPLRHPPWAPSTVASHSPQQTPACRKRVFQTRHPTTPISTTSNARGFPHSRGGGGEFFLNPEEQLTIEDMICRGFSQWFTETFSNADSLPGTRSGKEAWVTAGAKSPQDPNAQPQNGNTQGTVELPDILPEQLKEKMKAILPNSSPSSLTPSPHNNNSRKVQFTEGLPFIQGNGIVVLQNNNGKQEPPPSESKKEGTRSAQNGGSAKTDQAVADSRDRKDVLQAPWSAPLTSRSMSTLAPRSKLFKHMPIPKIDMVSEIYDELIVKTIQSFLEKEGYSPERVTALRNNIMARLSATYPHLARHRAWKLVRKDAAGAADSHGETEADDPRSRTRLRPLHQGFFAAHSVSDLAANFTKENQSALHPLPHGSRNPTDQIRPRWVPVQPAHRPTLLQEEERCANAMFMSVDGRHISITPRDDLRYKTPTLPGATSDYRMAPLVIHDASNKPVKTWTHIIPSAVHN